jgi:RNA polymerase sigma factor (sigma-70 family)
VTAASSSSLVYVVDDDEAVRDSLGWLLASIGYRVATYSTAEQFLEGYKAGAASCLVLDVRMPGVSGLELQQELNRRGETLPVIFITGHGDVPMAVNAVKSGAFHFLEKPFKDAQLVSLIEQAAKLGRTPDEERQGPCVAARLASLTQREREVIDLVVQGLKNRQIADQLGISVKTVEAHRARVMEKMSVGSVAELVQVTLAVQRQR